MNEKTTMYIIFLLIIIFAGMSSLGYWYSIDKTQAIPFNIPKSSQQQDKNKKLIRIGTIGIDVLDKIRTYQPLAKYLNQCPELKSYHFETTVARDIPTMIKMINNKQIEIFIDTVFPVIETANHTKLKLILRRWKKGVREYHSVVFVNKNSNINSLANLKGHIIAFEDIGSTSSYALPKASISNEGFKFKKVEKCNSEVPKDKIGYLFSKDDDNTFIWVVKNKISAGATNNAAFIKIAPNLKKQLKIIHNTPTVPRSIVACRRELSQKFINLFIKSLVNMEKTPNGKATLFELSKTVKFEKINNEEKIINQTNNLLSKIAYE